MLGSTGFQQNSQNQLLYDDSLSPLYQPTNIGEPLTIQVAVKKTKQMSAYEQECITSHEHLQQYMGQREPQPSGVSSMSLTDYMFQF